MSATFFSRIALSLALAGAAVVPMSGTSFAGSGTGKITTYHLNSDIAGRGACVKTNPALPNPGWACVWYNNQLYKELEELLLQGYINGKTCTVQWDTTDVDGNFLISLVECD